MGVFKDLDISVKEYASRLSDRKGRVIKYALEQCVMSTGMVPIKDVHKNAGVREDYARLMMEEAVDEHLFRISIINTTRYYVVLPKGKSVYEFCYKDQGGFDSIPKKKLKEL